MNLLFVSLAFPPKNNPECIQTARYFKYLGKEHSWKVDVVTSSSPTLFMPVDVGLKKYDVGYRQKIEITLFESKLLNFVLRKLGMRRLLFPDSKMTFHWQWRNATHRLSVKPDLIYSRSNPMSSAVMALKLKKHFNVPWVMHMSDPWGISPLEDMPADTKRKALIMEEKLLNEACKITFTSSQTLNLYTARYPMFASKFSVLPNVYDPEDVREVSWSELKKLRIVYTGGLAGKRNVFFLNQVMKIASQRNPDLTSELEFIFAGDMDRSNRAFFEKAHPCLRHMGILSHADAQKLCESAHLLMVVDNPTLSQEAIFFPSKLLDYFLVKRKIWAVTPIRSVTRDLLRGTNHAAFHHDEIDAMVDFVLEDVRLFKMGELSFFQSDTVPPEFNAKTNARILSELLKQAVL